MRRSPNCPSREYDPRLDGVVGGGQREPVFGGIFGQRKCPKNHPGVFTCRYALPEYVENAGLIGGGLRPNTLEADSISAMPIEKDIMEPDLGDPANERSGMGGLFLLIVGATVGYIIGSSK